MSLRAILTAAAILATMAIAPPGAAAHVQYDGAGRFMHQSHSRDLWYINGVDHSGWRTEARDAQIQIHEVFNGSLRLYTTSNHDAAVIHAVDDYYDSCCPGFAGWWAYHGGHGHLQLNNVYNGLSDWQKQATACHETGHFIGLMHTNDASDCLHTPLSSMPSAMLGIDHRDQMRAAWNGWGH